MKRRSPLRVTITLPRVEHGNPAFRESLKTVTDEALEAMLLRGLRNVQKAHDSYIEARRALANVKSAACDVEQVLRSRGALSDRVEDALRDTYPVGP